jgi:hypothetical protein
MIKVDKTAVKKSHVEINGTNKWYSKYIHEVDYNRELENTELQEERFAEYDWN